MAYSKKAVFGDSDKFREHNDCAVKALALTTHLSYPAAHATLGDAGRKCRHRTRWPTIERAYMLAGYSLKPVNVEAKTVMKIEIDSSFKASKKYLVKTSGHVLAVRKGKVLDWTAGRRHRIQHVYEVVKGHEYWDDDYYY